MNALKKLFLHELNDRYDSEKQLMQALPKMAKSALCKNLVQMIQEHVQETEGHLKNLDNVFRSFAVEVIPTHNAATKGLLKESDCVQELFKDTCAIDAALISSAQKILHYEIASYGCLHEWAGVLGNNEAAWLLKENLIEVESSNHQLIGLARTQSNKEAFNEPDLAHSGRLNHE